MTNKFAVRSPKQRQQKQHNEREFVPYHSRKTEKFEKYTAVMVKVNYQR